MAKKSSMKKTSKIVPKKRVLARDIFEKYIKYLRNEYVVEADDVGDIRAYCDLRWGEEDYQITINLWSNTDVNPKYIEVGISHDYDEIIKKVPSGMDSDEFGDLVKENVVFDFSSDEMLPGTKKKIKIGLVEVDYQAEGNEVLFKVSVSTGMKQHIKINVPSVVDDKFIKKMDNEVTNFSNMIFRAAFDEASDAIDREISNIKKSRSKECFGKKKPEKKEKPAAKKSAKKQAAKKPAKKASKPAKKSAGK